MKNIVLFIRTHNDMDHALPILDYLIRVKSMSVKVYSVGSDYKKYARHLSYMEDALSISLISFEDTYYSILDRKLLSIKYKLSKNKNHYGRLFGVIYEIFYANIKNIIWWLSSGAAKRFVSDLPASTSILADVGVESTFPYRYIIKSAQKNNFPVIAYHHGFNVFVNPDFHRSKPANLPSLLNKFFLNVILHKNNKVFFDKYLIGKRAPGTFFAGAANPSFKDYSRVVEIGLPRFSTEWMNTFIKNWNRKVIESDNSGEYTNVALFVSNVKFNVNKDILKMVIDRLISSKKVKLIIMPHTRSGPSGLNQIDYSSYLTDMSSTDVIEWADIGIVYGTSIAFQMLFEEVIMLVPKFIDGNKTVFEDGNVCITSNTLDDMMDFIDNYKKGIDVMDRETVKKFIREYVYGGYNSYEEMMDVYLEHIFGNTQG